MKFIIRKSPSPTPENIKLSISSLTEKQQQQKDKVMESTFYDLYVMKWTYYIQGWINAVNYSELLENKEIEETIEAQCDEWAWNAIKYNTIDDYTLNNPDEEGELPKLVSN